MMDGVELDERLVDLETKSAYQEHLIQALNEVIIEQQQQLDALLKDMLGLKTYLRDMNAQESTDVVDAPPPHY
ncbi:MAG: SlyX family protein [Mariprofundaceae bacterium]|nr:SlyX family protein [Mariprofundaceae bacterium]